MSIAKEQAKAKPKMDEIVGDILHEENLKNALDLMAFAKENKISLRWSSTNAYQLYYKSKRIGIIRMTVDAYKMYAMPVNSWYFSPWDSHDILDELISTEKNAKEIIWNNVRVCSSCGSCKPRHDRTIFGKVFEKTCHAWFHMVNPNKDTIDCIKSLLRIKKNHIDNAAV